MSTIYELCVQKYERGGQAAVFEYVLSNFPELEWKNCDPCESSSPIDDGLCLVCGSKVAA